MLDLKPSLLQFETSTSCNAKCIFCEHQNMKRCGSAKWSTLLNNMYNYVYQVNEVCPFGMQEPTLEPRLPSILTQIKQFKPAVKTTIYSNMQHYDEAWWTRIIKFELLDTLAISFYGVDKATFNKLQPPLDYENVQRNIKQLVKLKRKLHMDKPEVNLHVLVIPETYGKAAFFAKKWRRILGDSHVGYVHWDSWCGKKPYNDKFESLIWGKPAETRTPCPRLWSSINIHFDGTLVPCCLDAHETEPCGNINSDPDIWQNSKRLNEMRQLHIEGKQSEIPLCKDCTVWLRDHPKEWNQLWMNQKTVSYAANLST